MNGEDTRERNGKEGPVTQRFDPDAPAEARPTTRLPDPADGEAPVTARLPETPVTDRFPEARATARLPEARATRRFDGRGAPRPSLVPGDRVADAYRVEEGPLRGATGEAEVYRATELESGDAVALKFYHEDVAPKETVLKSLLKVHHPHVVTLRDYGVWGGRFFEVMDFCRGGNLADHMPIEEPDLRVFLESILQGLQYLHTRGIVHRDIKPNNLLFRKPDRQELVIGDFGVSSVLEGGETVRKTRSGAFFTLDYAAPELLDGKEVGPKTDYYALGITLLHLLTGRSPFAGMDKNTILGCHFRGKVPRPREISKEFEQLIEGLLRVAPESRWGYRQVTAWLRNEMVLTDDGLPDRAEIEVGKKLPYRNQPAITTPREMVARLDRFDAAKDLQRGFISQWLMYFDVALAERVAQLEEEFADNPSLGVFKLRYLLDPAQPLEVCERKVYNVEQLATLLATGSERERRALADLLFSGGIGVWLAALQTDAETRRLVARIEALAERLRDRPSLALFALLYTLDPRRPLMFPGGASIRWLDEIESILPTHTRALRHYLYTGHLCEWLRACFPERVEDFRFVEGCMREYGRKDEDLGLFALRCRYNPNLPLSIGTRAIETPRELAQRAGNSRAFFENTAYLVSRGWLRVWLVNTGRLRDPAPFDEIVRDPAASIYRKTEALLHILDPSLPWPTLASDTDRIDAGPVSTEQSKTAHITFFNAGRGYLSGMVTLAAGEAGFEMIEQPIEGDSTTVTVTVSGKGLSIGTEATAFVVADTNGGRLEIPVTFRVSSPTWRCFARSLGVGAVVGGVFGLFRLGLQRLLPEYYTLNVMDWVSRTDLGDYSHPGAAVVLVLLALTLIPAAAYYLYVMDRVNNEDLPPPRPAPDPAPDPFGFPGEGPP